mmetsp:Transcript_60503/g.187433  ORF Transcript_60503/g.187433 Transcript_60503/m.187433 type:complete len:262 (+) Transcript_60503:342-1127(+)
MSGDGDLAHCVADVLGCEVAPQPRRCSQRPLAGEHHDHGRARRRTAGKAYRLCNGDHLTDLPQRAPREGVLPGTGDAHGGRVRRVPHGRVRVGRGHLRAFASGLPVGLHGAEPWLPSLQAGGTLRPPPPARAEEVEAVWGQVSHRHPLARPRQPPRGAPGGPAGAAPPPRGVLPAPAVAGRPGEGGRGSVWTSQWLLDAATCVPAADDEAAATASTRSGGSTDAASESGSADATSESGSEEMQAAVSEPVPQKSGTPCCVQ